MIDQQAVKTFMESETDEWDWVKALSREDLIEEIEEVGGLPYEMLFKTRPRLHQLASFLLGLYWDRFMFTLDMGTGKTKIVLDLAEYFKSYGLLETVLFLVPNITAIGGIEEQVLEHSKLVPKMLLGTRPERQELLTESANVYIINYMGLVTLTCERYQDEEAGPREFKYVVDDKKIRQFVKQFDMIVFDESHVLKNKQALTTRICNRFAQKLKYVYCLTGTPMNRDPIDIWTQTKFIDGGVALGPTLGMLRQAYYTETENNWGGKDYTFNKRFTSTVAKRIKHRSIRYTEAEVNDLPPKVYIIKPIILPQENKEHYDNALDGLIKAQGSFTELDNAYMKLRQISSGFLSFIDDDGNKIFYEFPENPKLEMLVDIIKESPLASKLVVFNWFIPTGDLIAKRFKKEGIKFERLFSGTKDPIEAVQRFKTNSKIKVFLANTQSAAVSLNLQVANYCIFFESPNSLIPRKQAVKRVHRTGQQRKSFIYDIAVKNSIEFKILKGLSEGKELFSDIVDGKILIKK